MGEETLLFGVSKGVVFYMRVCHMTSAHPSNDTRLLIKECPTLAKAGYETYLVAKGKSYEQNGVHVVGLGNPPKSRFFRMFTFAKKVYQKALELNCDVYHMHDPELLPYGIKLKKKGKIVIFDCHEDVAGTILDKLWIPKLFRKLVSTLYRYYEKYAAKKLDAIVVATPHIATLFRDIASNVAVVNNYPELSDIAYQSTPFSERGRNIGYAGGLDACRGKDFLLEAIKGMDVTLTLAGEHHIHNFENVVCIGKANRHQVNELYANSRLGVVLYLPAANHYDAQPMKLFEYMAAGLPVVASNFPHWKMLVEDNQCGLCVSPTEVNEIKKAISYFLDNPDLAQKMGQNGRRAVLEKYSWDTQAQVLLALYANLGVSSGNNN